MRIPEWNWDKQVFEDRDYPDELFRGFLTWLLTTKAWVEYPDLVNTKVLTLQRQMADFRQATPSHQEPEARRSPEEQKRARQLANLEKARAARKAKREARVYAEA